MTAQLALISGDPLRDALREHLHEALRSFHGEHTQTVLPPGCTLLADGRRQLPIRDLLPQLDRLTDEEVAEMVGHYTRKERLWLTTYQGWKDDGDGIRRCLCVGPHSWQCAYATDIRVRPDGSGWRWSGRERQGWAPLLTTACRVGLEVLRG